MTNGMYGACSSYLLAKLSALRTDTEAAVSPATKLEPEVLASRELADLERRREILILEALLRVVNKSAEIPF